MAPPLERTLGTTLNMASKRTSLSKKTWNPPSHASASLTPDPKPSTPEHDHHDAITPSCTCYYPTGAVGEWKSEYRYHYRGIIGDYVGIIRGIHSPTLP